MCGIVGYIGYREAEPILINGLKRLEYRGYDSVGIAILNENFKFIRQRGRLPTWKILIDGKDLHGTIGMAHTRWATHGEPSDINAHPHFSQNDELALIHNGIIENYTVIRDYLIQYGYQFLQQYRHRSPHSTYSLHQENFGL